MRHSPRLTPPLVALLLVAGAGLCSADDKKPPDASQALTDLGRRYDLEIVFEAPGFPVDTAHGAITGSAASPDDVARYMPILVREWSLYPTSLVKRTRLKRIVLCKELAFAGQKRAAVPDFEHDAYYLDVVRGGHDRRYVRSVIHHDFFHLIDWRDDGELYSDASWARLNAEGFKYGSGGVNAQDDPTIGVDSKDTPGFLNRYATTGVEEDKAEVFSHLMVEPAKLEKQSKDDAVLAAKVRRMKELLVRFCPRMDDAYWERHRNADSQTPPKESVRSMP